MNVFADPVLSVRTASAPGIRQLSLPEVLQAAEERDLIDLSGLRPYQRPSVITAFAVLLHLGRRSLAEPFLARNFLELLEAAKLLPAGRLVAPFAQSAFLQPILDPPPRASEWNTKTLGEIDGLFVGLGHETKARASQGSPDQWLYALICGNHRVQVAHNPAGVRWGLPCVLPSDSKTIGSEIRLLADAYDAAHAAMPRGSLAEHFAWLRPWDLREPPAPSGELPQPFLEAPRPLRLVDTNGQLGAVQIATHRRRIDSSDTLGIVGDPQVATVVGKGPYRWTKRRIGYRVWHAMLFGAPNASPPVEPASTARAMPSGTTHVRICGIAYDQGISEGYHERIFRVPEVRRRISIRDRGVSEAGLSKMALDAIAQASSSVLRPALNRLHDEVVRQRAIAGFEDAAGLETVNWVWEGFAGAIPADETTLLPLVASEARRAFASAAKQAASSGFSALSIADAQLVFESRLRREFGAARSEDQSMTGDEIPPLCRQVAAVVQALAYEVGEPDSDVAKRLRSMDHVTPGLVFWSILAAPSVPAAWCENRRMQPGLLALLSGMARVRHVTKRDGQWVDSLGRALAKVGYTEQRMSSLLGARGSALAEGISHARQMLESRGIDSLDWRLAAQLLVSDALDDAEALGWARRRLALDYARQMRAEAARTAA